MSDGTLSAVDGDRVIYFTDYVYEGDTVDVYRTVEDAEWERGPAVPRVVCREGDEWWLRPKEGNGDG